MPRLLLLIVAQTCLFVSLAWAEPSLDRLVTLLNDVCVMPATPEAMMEAGAKFIAAHAGKLISSGPTSLPMMHNETGPKISFTSMWEADLGEGTRAGLAMSIVRPEIPGVKHSVCMIQPEPDVDPAGLAQAIEQYFGAALVRNLRYTDGKYWFFAQEKAVGNCGKELSVSWPKKYTDDRPLLMFTDFAYPKDGNWNGPYSSTLCRP